MAGFSPLFHTETAEMSRWILAVTAMLTLAGCAETVVESLKMGSEIGILGDMRTLHIAQSQFMLSKGRYGTFAELRDAGLINASFVESKRHGFVITQISADATGYALRADPKADDGLRRRHFYIDQSGVVRANDSKPAGPTDRPAVR